MTKPIDIKILWCVLRNDGAYSYISSSDVGYRMTKPVHIDDHPQVCFYRMTTPFNIDDPQVCYGMTKAIRIEQWFPKWGDGGGTSAKCWDYCSFNSASLNNIKIVIRVFLTAKKNELVPPPVFKQQNCNVVKVKYMTSNHINLSFTVKTANHSQSCVSVHLTACHLSPAHGYMMKLGNSS